MKVPTTTEELKTVLTAFKTQDPNGNGQADEVPMLGKAEMVNYIMNAFVSYRQGEFNVTDGKIWDPVKTDEFRQGLIYANELVTAGLYNKLSFTISGTSDYKAMISPTSGSSKVGIWVGAPERLTNPATDALSEFIAFQPLADATGKGGYTITKDPDLTWVAYITKDCKYPAAAMKLIDTFYLDETISRQRHGEKDVDWVYEEGKNQVGTDSYVKPMNSEAFFGGNATWCLNACGIMTHWNYLQVADDGASSRQADCNRLAKEQWTIIENGNAPKEEATRLIYTSEEYEIREEKSGTVGSYINEQVLLFVSGEKNPKDDAAWNEFLTTLDNLGRSELMDICQQAYDRK